MDLAPRSPLSMVLALCALALSAFFVAHGTSSLIAARLVPKGLARLASAPRPAELLPGAALPDHCAILARNVFDSSVGSLCPEPVAGAALPPPPAPPVPGESPPACEGGARQLVATVCSEHDATWSFAQVTGASGAPLLLRRGAYLDGDEVFAVQPRAVLFRRSSGDYCSLGFRADAGQAPRPLASPPAASDDAVAGVTAISETAFRVSRAAVARLYENRGGVMQTVRVIPHEVEGRVVGVKLYGARNGSIWRALGLQNGDLLRAIDGEPLASPEVALQAYARLRSASHVALSVERRGVALTLQYAID